MQLTDTHISWLLHNKSMSGSSDSAPDTSVPTGSDQGSATVSVPEVAIVGDLQPNQSVDPNAGQQNQAIAETTDQPGESMGPGMMLAGASVSLIVIAPQPPADIDPGNLQLPRIPEPFPNGPTGIPKPLGEPEPAPDMNPAETSMGVDAEETVLEQGTGLAEETTLAEEGLVLIPEEATVPVVGWILIGVTLLLVGYVAYKAYIVTQEGKPIRPATPEEAKQAEANQGKPIPTAQDPQTGEPLYTPADGEYSPAIDPATGRPFQAPGARGAQNPAQASSQDDDLDRHDHEDYAEKVLSEGPDVTCEQLEEAISGLIEALRERALQMEDPKRTDRRTYDGHKQRYEWARDLLKRLVSIADGREDCGINTGEAKDWINTDPPPPQ